MSSDPFRRFDIVATEGFQRNRAWLYHAVSHRRTMPTTIGNLVVYRIGEALAAAGLSRATYFRWVKGGRVPDTHYKDRNGHRVFTEAELASLLAEAGRLMARPTTYLADGTNKEPR